MSTAPVVRIAVSEDAPSIYAMCKMLHEENGQASWSEDKIRGSIGGALAGKKAVIGVIGPRGAPVAMIHLRIGSFWYSDDIHLEDRGTFVHPDHRRTSYAKDLIEFAKMAAEDLKIPLLMGIASTKRTEQKIRLCRRRLGAPLGAYFIWNGRK
jgi:GNAT superfamily N-acetyltransferase